MVSSKTLIFATLTCLAFHNSSFAFTGAQLVQQDTSFNNGYMLGAVDAYLNIYQNDPAEQKRQQQVATCLIDGGITNGVLNQAVVNYIQNNPATLAQPAVAAILKTLLEICPKQ